MSLTWHVACGSAVLSSMLLAERAGAEYSYVPMPEVPEHRLEVNLASQVSEHPTDAYGFAALGRLRSLRLQQEVARIRADLDLAPALDASVDVDLPTSGSGWQTHAAGAVSAFERALAIGASIEGWDRLAVTHHSYAWVLEYVAQNAEKVEVLPDADSAAVVEPGRRSELQSLLSALESRNAWRAKKRLDEESDGAVRVFFEHRGDARPSVRAYAAERVRRYWRERAKHHYRLSFELAVDRDAVHLDEVGRRWGDGSLLSTSAGMNYLRLERAQPTRWSSADEQRSVQSRLHRVRLTRPGELPPGAITPMVIPLGGEGTLAELADDGAAVAFDLDGTGAGEAGDQRWTWVKPNAGILVWDPAGTGRITSGRQLFGSASWWVLPRDGFHALAMLDNDADGELAGDELRGIGVWVDADGDAVSDPGEVAPVAQRGVAGLRTMPDGFEGAAPVCRSGVRMTDGTLRPSFDWIARAAPTEMK